MDGWVTIGTKLDIKNLEKGIKDAERQLRQLEKDGEKLSETKIKLELDIQEYERQKQLIEESINERLKLAQTEEQVNFVLGEEETELQELNEKYKEQFSSLEDINKKIQENANNQGLVNNKIKEMTNELNQSKGLNYIKSSIDNVGNSIESVIKKVGRWALAIFGVRSAYMFVRQAMSTLSQYNDQIATDVQYLRYSLATALQPIIETIIKLAYKLLAYTAYIAKAWFGVNIFAKASSKAFGEANNKVKATNKSAKELQKTIAGFDEMNILQENGGVSSGGGGGGIGDITTPSMDLSKWQNVEIPGWVKWLAEHGNLVKDILIGIGLAIAGIKIAEFLNKLGLLGEGFSKFKTLLVGLGIAFILYGIYEMIQGIIDFVKDPSWENFSKILEGLEDVLIGVGIAMVALNASNPVGWIMLAIGAVGKLISKLSSQKKSTDDLREAEKKLKDARKNLLSATDEYINAVDEATQAQKNLKDAQEKTGINIDELLKKMDEEGLTYEDLNDKQKEVYKAYIDNQNAQQNLIEKKKNLNKATKDEANASIDVQRETAKSAEQYDKLRESIVKNYEQGKISAKDARKQIMQAMADMDDDAKKKFVNGIPNKIMSAFDTKKYKSTFGSFESFWNRSLNNLKDTLTLNITTKITNTFENAVASATSKIKKSAKGSIIYPTRIPKLATGGIVNMPGSGIYHNGSIIGERGAEAVVPLTDSQQMQLLGEAIGKYITINANITNTMNGRVISKELQKINNESNFAFNR